MPSEESVDSDGSDGFGVSEAWGGCQSLIGAESVQEGVARSLSTGKASYLVLLCRRIKNKPIPISIAAGINFCKCIQ